MFMLTSRKDRCGSCLCDKDGIPVGDIVSGATEVSRGVTGAEGL